VLGAAVREERGLRSEVRGESREEGRGGRLRLEVKVAPENGE
jgi:hypothetical protein